MVNAELAAQYRRDGWWPDHDLVSRFRGLVEAAPDAPSVRDDRGAALTRGQLWTQAEELARVLAAHGVEPRSVVLVLLPNRVDWQVALLACLQIGAVPATLPLTTDRRALAHIGTLVGARAVVTLGRHRGRDLESSTVEAMRAGGRRCDVVLFEDGLVVRTIGLSGTTAPAAQADLDHLMFTSSTTGLPKAVMHTANTLAAVNLGFIERFGLGEDTPLFMPSPLGHSVGAWHGARLSLFCGAPLVLQDLWDPVRALHLVAQSGSRFMAAATPFLKDLLDARWDDAEPKLASMRTFLCGGAPVPPHLMRQALEQLPQTFVTVLWGMTEGGVTTGVPGDHADRRALQAGRPLPDLELQTVPTPAAADGVGELVMRGPGVFVGYLGQDELYTESLTPDGYFRTGDLARLDDDGYLSITGRVKDLIVRGGVNISPIPIESAIAEHPRVRQVAVIGAPDERLGERILAVVVLADDDPLELDELTAWLTEGGLSRRLLPEGLVVVQEMPMTAAGKIRKVDLQDQLAAER